MRQAGKCKIQGRVQTKVEYSTHIKLCFTTLVLFWESFMYEIKNRIYISPKKYCSNLICLGIVEPISCVLSSWALFLHLQKDCLLPSLINSEFKALKGRHIHEKVSGFDITEQTLKGYSSWTAFGISAHMHTQTHTHSGFTLPAQPQGWHMERWGQGGCMPKDETENIERSKDGKMAARICLPIAFPLHSPLYRSQTFQ